MNIRDRVGSQVVVKISATSEKEATRRRKLT